MGLQKKKGLLLGKNNEMIGNRTCPTQRSAYRSGTVLESNQFPQSILFNFQTNVLSIYLNIMMSKKPGEKLNKVMIFGTFDGLHPGHLHFFNQARQLAKNPFLVVSIARDKNVKRIKGKIPEFNERQRMLLVKKSGLVDKVIFSGITDHLPHITKEAPGFIALGYDQEAYVKNLKKDLKNLGLVVKIVRLKPHHPNIYKNHLLKNKQLVR